MMIISIILIVVLLLCIIHIFMLSRLIALNFGALVKVYGNDDEFDYFSKNFMNEEEVVDLKKICNKNYFRFLEIFNKNHVIISLNNNTKYTPIGYAVNLACKYPKCIIYRLFNKTYLSKDEDLGLEIYPLTGVVYRTKDLEECV